jgi:E3 ubiquitin-protein ligase RAD18
MKRIRDFDLTESDRNDRAGAVTPPLQQLPTRRSAPLNPSPTKQLSHLNYNLLRDNPLKKKLQELGIPTWGSRQLLIRRHTQWVDIYNANCDSPRPRSNRELLKELDTWERTQGGNAPNQGQSVPTGVMKKDFDGVEWSGKHRNHFDDLVAKARAKIAPRAKQEIKDTPEMAIDAEPTAPLDTKEDSAVTTEKELSPDARDHPMEDLKEELHAPYIQSSTDSVHDPILPPALSMLSTAAHEIQTRPSSPPISCSEPHSLQINQTTNSNSQHIPNSSPEKFTSPDRVRRLPMFQVPEGQL